jgi:hypothetical protein
LPVSPAAPVAPAPPCRAVTTMLELLAGFVVIGVGLDVEDTGVFLVGLTGLLVGWLRRPGRPSAGTVSVVEADYSAAARAATEAAAAAGTVAATSVAVATAISGAVTWAACSEWPGDPGEPAGGHRDR